MQKKPYSMIPALADRTYLYLFNYAGDPDDFDLDQGAFDTELAKHACLGNSCAENGIGLTGTDLTVTDATTYYTIETSTATTFDASQVKCPIVFFKGKAIPYSHYNGASPPSTTNGLITLTTATYADYTDVETDYVVYYSDHLTAYLISAEVGGVTLPIDTNSFNAVGHEEPVYVVTKRGTADGTGSVNVIMDLTAHLMDTLTAPVNWPGEELQKRIYGSDWTVQAGWDARNPLQAPTQPFGIALLKHSGKSYGAAQGNVWAVLTCVYHCELTTVSPLGNVSNDSTDPVSLSIDFTTKYPDKTDQAVILTPA